MATEEDWRAKYLSALEKQEALESKMAAYGDILRRVVLNLGAAASGLDVKIDASVGVLKGYLKTAGGQKVFEQLRVVEAAVSEFEEKRFRSHEALNVELQAIVKQLLALNLPSETYALVKGYSRELKKLPTNFLAYPDLIRKLNVVHAKVIAAAAAPEKNFWQRMRGGTRLLSADTELNSAEPVLDTDSDLGNNDEAAESEAEVCSANSPGGPLELSLDKKEFEELKAEIQSVFGEVLNSVEAAEASLPKLQSAKARIEQGLEAESLLESLEDLRDVLMSGFIRYDSEFSEYLARVNSELSAICEALGLGAQQHQDQLTAAQTFEQVVSEQMGAMESVMAASSSMDELKKGISERIQAINSALSDFKNQQRKSSSLSEELTVLTERVKAIETESAQAKAMLEKERHKAMHDPLTELPNREAYRERANFEHKRFQRYGSPLSVAVCDIDHFKQFNDNFGHQVGDRVLKLIAKALRQRLREVDFVARYGGEEFVMFLPHTDLESAVTALDKIRHAIAESAFRVKQNPVKITLSFGVTQFQPEDTVSVAFERADKALYAAKEAGRNQVAAL